MYNITEGNSYVHIYSYVANHISN